jgi:hypothetical protein
MALTNSWPGVNVAATTTDARRNLAGMLVKDTTGTARSGIFPAHANALVSARSDMNVDIAVFTGAAVQFGGPVLIANDGVAQLPSALVSPGAGTNYYVIYAKQNESAAPGTDANNNRVLGAQLSTTSLALARAALPAGALELGTVEMPTGKTATNQSGVIVTQTAQYTAAAGGVIWFRTTTERDAATTYADGQLAEVIGDTRLYRSTGGVWKLVNTGLHLIKPSAVSGGTISGDGAVAFTGQNLVNIDGIFSSGFDNYVIEIDVTTVSAITNVFTRLRASGTSDTAANYYAQQMWGQGSSVSAVPQNAQGIWIITSTPANYHSIRLEVHKPADAAVRTSAIGDAMSADVSSTPVLGSHRGSYWHGTPATYDGIAFSANGAITMSGTIRVYGYYNG